MTGATYRQIDTVGQDRLSLDLRALGLAAGATVLVHCGLSRIGPVVGGPATLLAALLDVLGPAGNLVVPTQTSGNSVTSRAFRNATAGMTAAQIVEAEANIPPFDPDRSPAEGMGVLAEHVRQQSDAVRSRHPETSFAALGPGATALTAIHDLECHLGERSPLGALYAADAVVLLLGVDYSACTALHLAEYRRRRPAGDRSYRAYVLKEGRRVRHDFLALDLDDQDFPLIGQVLDTTSFVRMGRVGNGFCRLIRMRPAVDLAADWMDEHRGP